MYLDSDGKHIFAEDVLVGMLSNIQTIKLPTYDFHKTIFQLQEQKRFSKYLKGFKFSLGGLGPYSELLETAIFNLEASSILQAISPSFEAYYLPRDLKEKLKIRTEKIFPDPKDRKNLEEMASEFEEIITKE
ncbi:MAG TPA: hypothetical protein PLK34_02560 [Candidatus Pacearchaeota archaeon]|nr:hypothetical protein [Candidatus Pacearchaeota archaeon]